MSKRNVSFIKPEDPSFLKRIKEQINYKEGPSVDSKRQRIENWSDDDEDRDISDEEKPQVVVLKSGDLTAEQADTEQKRIEREEAERPADLSQRVIFNKVKPKSDKGASDNKVEENKSKKKKDKKENNSKSIQSSKLSFAHEFDDEEADNE